MTSRTFFSGLIIFIVLSFEALSQGYDLRFKVNGIKDTTVYLANYYGDKQYLKDSSKADASGKFSFKGKEPLPGGIYIAAFRNRIIFEFILDKQQNFSMETDYMDPVTSMKVKGSDDNSIFYDHLRYINSKHKEVQSLKEKMALAKTGKDSSVLKNQITAIDDEVEKYKNDFIAKHAGSFVSVLLKSSSDIEIPDSPRDEKGKTDSSFAYKYYKEHFWDNIDLSDERLLRTPVMHKKIEEYVKKLTFQIPDSINAAADFLIGKTKDNKEMFKYIVWYITHTYETSNIMGMDAVFVYMADKYYTKEKAYWVGEADLVRLKDRANQLRPILVGRKVKNLVLEDSAGVYHSLYNVKTKYTILYFWDPDCGHCKKVTPKLLEYYAKVKTKNVEVFAICNEVEIDKWKAYIKEYKLPWINVADPHLHNNFRHEFDVSTTPQIFLLDENKVIIAKKIDVDVLEQMLNKKLEEGS